MLTVDGRGIDYHETGKGPAVLFVPGSFSTLTAWRGMQKRLPQHYRFVGTIDTSRRPNLRSTMQNILAEAKKRDEARDSGERVGIPLKSMPKKYAKTEKHKRGGIHPTGRKGSGSGKAPTKRKPPPPQTGRRKKRP